MILFQVELLADRNADNAMLPNIPQLQVYYAQLLYIVRVTIPQNNKIRVAENCEALLGIVRWCKGAVGDASLRPVWYTEMGSIAAVNIATIQCAVGRVKVGTRWGIIDLNYGCASTTFMGNEDEGDGSDED